MFQHSYEATAAIDHIRARASSGHGWERASCAMLVSAGFSDEQAAHEIIWAKHLRPGDEISYITELLNKRVKPSDFESLVSRVETGFHAWTPEEFRRFVLEFTGMSESLYAELEGRVLQRWSPGGVPESLHFGVMMRQIQRLRPRVGL